MLRYRAPAWSESLSTSVKQLATRGSAMAAAPSRRQGAVSAEVPAAASANAPES